MAHHWFNNSDNDNFRVNFEYLKNHLYSDTYNNKPHLTCFSHVPKTGGTSLESILAKNFLMSETLHVNAPDLNQQPELLQLKKRPPKLLCGHHPMHGLLYQLLTDKPIFHLTQLRDPVDRVLSYFNYVKGKTDHPMHRYAKDTDMTEFLRANPSPELSNGQAKRFSGHLHSDPHHLPDDKKLFHTAQLTLTACFSLVLTTCLFDQGLLLLKKRLGLKDIYYMRSNVSKRHINREDLSNEQLRLIESMNQADIKLFDWARTQCMKLIDNELTATEIAEFRVNNKRWAELVRT